jgi:hypothetical protein
VLPLTARLRRGDTGPAEALCLPAPVSPGSCPIHGQHRDARHERLALKEVQRLWNDDLPEFEDRKEAEAFFAALLQGLCNGLSAHQKRSDPFKLARVKTAPASYEYLARLGKVRREEIDGFIDWLFAGQEEIDFPESAHKAVGTLGELRGLFAATEDMALNPPGPADVSTMEQTVKHLRELARIAEVEINTIIQSCRRARQQMLETQTMERPGTLH